MMLSIGGSHPVQIVDEKNRHIGRVQQDFIQSIFQKACLPIRASIGSVSSSFPGDFGKDQVDAEGRRLLVEPVADGEENRCAINVYQYKVDVIGADVGFPKSGSVVR